MPLLKSLPGPEEKPQKNELPSDSTSGPDNSVLTQKEKIAALKTEEIQLTQQLLRDFPGSDATLAFVGSLYGQHGNNAEAVKLLNKALELNPNLVSALNGRGSAFIFANRIRDALKDWEKAIAIKPDFTDIYFNIAITYLQLKSRQEALKYLNICKEKYYYMLSPRDRQRLNRLIREAGG